MDEDEEDEDIDEDDEDDEEDMDVADTDSCVFVDAATVWGGIVLVGCMAPTVIFYSFFAPRRLF